MVDSTFPCVFLSFRLLSAETSPLKLVRSTFPYVGSYLDRFQAAVGYTPENTRLICQECDIKAQAAKRYTDEVSAADRTPIGGA